MIINDPILEDKPKKMETANLSAKFPLPFPKPCNAVSAISTASATAGPSGAEAMFSANVATKFW